MQRDWLGSGCQHKMCGTDGVRAGVGLDPDSLAVQDLASTLNDLHLALLQETCDACFQSFDDAVLPLDGAVKIERRFPERYPESRRAGELNCLVINFRRMDECLRWNAADVQAASAQCRAFDQNGVEAELTRSDRCDIAARTATDNQDLRVDLTQRSLG